VDKKFHILFEILGRMIIFSYGISRSKEHIAVVIVAIYPKDSGKIMIETR
jgi:hypothetical protein